MLQEILKELEKITPEEKAILEGKSEVDRSIYVSDSPEVFDAAKLIGDERNIAMRPHTRFIHFFKHTHNYIEFVYMCKGKTHHVVNGKDVFLEKGELLFLNQNATQEIYPAEEGDIAINFFILPEFLEYGLGMIETEKNQLKDFVLGCLRGTNDAPGYLHFKVSDVLSIQNLIENLIVSIYNRDTTKKSINQATMGLLFLELINCLDRLETDTGSEQKLILDVLGYIEENYTSGKLSELAEMLDCDFNWLSKEIKKRTGKTYTDLVQNKRLSTAAYLLTATSKTVMDIALEVGYDNISYFHRIFQSRYGVSPKKYRLGK